jgi:hypothetical protein
VVERFYTSIPSPTAFLDVAYIVWLEKRIWDISGAMLTFVEKDL